jgi:hypothetical protein
VFHKSNILNSVFPFVGSAKHVFTVPRLMLSAIFGTLDLHRPLHFHYHGYQNHLLLGHGQVGGVLALSSVLKCSESVGGFWHNHAACYRTGLTGAMLAQSANVVYQDLAGLFGPHLM